VDLVTMRALYWDRGDGTGGASYDVRDPPSSLSDKLRQAHERLLEVAADEDPRILEAVLEGRERDVSPSDLRRGLRRATLQARIVPVLCGTAYHNVGVQPLLDAVVDLLPSPIDRGPVRAASGDAERPPSRTAPLAAIAFKVAFDDHGQMTFV